MARRMPGSPSCYKVLEAATGIYLDDPLNAKPEWYFTEEEIEEHSRSREDDIDSKYESHLRQSYCSYIQDLGRELKVPQVTIATAMMLCHRFYMHQSHAKSHFQTIANACMFLACKAEDTPRWLKDLVVVAYKLMYSWDPLASQKIRQKEVYDKQKQLIMLAEQLVLVAVAFDLNIEHPYKPLTSALRRLGVSRKEVVQVAWNYVNDSLRTTLCLQYKPHYIAAGSIYLAAKRHKIKLPSANGQAWWMQFDVSPKQLQEVIQHMHHLLDQTSDQATSPASAETTRALKSVTAKRKIGSSEPCISGRSVAGQDSTNLETSGMLSESAVVKNCSQKQPSYDAQDTVQTKESCLSDSGSAISVVDDGDAELVTGDSNQSTGCKIVPITESCPKVDIARIRERLKRRKLDIVKNMKPRDNSEDAILSGDDWIERELEKGIGTVYAVS